MSRYTGAEIRRLERRGRELGGTRGDEISHCIGVVVVVGGGVAGAWSWVGGEAWFG